jgi:hypothetical protein
METQNNFGQKMEVTVEEVSKDSNEIYINDGQGNEGWFPVREPAKIQYCKTGKASITITNNTITFCKSLDNNNVNHSNTYSKPYQKPYSKPNYGGFRSSNQSNPIQPANQYKPKEECYYEESEILFEGVGFIESQKIVEDLKKQGKWVFYVQRLPRYGDFAEGEDKVTHYKYDIAIGIKEKRLGKRPENQPQEEFL